MSEAPGLATRALLLPRSQPAPRVARGRRLLKPTLALDETRNRFHARTGAQVGEDERPLAAHALGVAFHHRQRGTDMRRQVRLVDDEQIRAGDAGSTLARDFLALGDVD